jgi:hypothetical protein
LFGKFKPKYIRINNHIIQLEAIGTVSSSVNSYPNSPASYEILINYNGGASICIVLTSKEEVDKAIEKIANSLKAF